MESWRPFRFADAGASRLWEIRSAADLSSAAISLAPGASITAVYSEGGHLRSRHWSLDGKPLTEATDLFLLAEPLVGLHLEEVAAEPKLDVVVGPKSQTNYSLVQWVLNGTPKQTGSTVPGFEHPPLSLKTVSWGDRTELVTGRVRARLRGDFPCPRIRSGDRIARAWR